MSRVIWVRVVFRKTVVDRRFDYLSGSHLQSLVTLHKQDSRRQTAYRNANYISHLSREFSYFVWVLDSTHVCSGFTISILLFNFITNFIWDTEETRQPILHQRQGIRTHEFSLKLTAMNQSNHAFRFYWLLSAKDNQVEDTPTCPSSQNESAKCVGKTEL